MQHGGDIQAAARQWSIPEAQWLDLSTAISPFSYPLPSVPQTVWHRLPYTNDAFIQNAKQYYQCESLLPVAGTQQAIEILPRVLPGETVAVPRIGYSEHETHWRLSGREIRYYNDAKELDHLIEKQNIDIAIVINPNNPTGELVKRSTLVDMAKKLAENKGYLLVDEAFIDAVPCDSLAISAPDNVIVLRSVGKFFGLAGIRMGFVIAANFIVEQLTTHVGLWRVSGPTQWATLQALMDFPWQREQIQRLEASSKMMYHDLRQCFPFGKAQYQSLFVSIELSTEQTETVFNTFATAAILLRKFVLPNKRGLLRFGLLPADAKSIERFYKALEHAAAILKTL